MLLHCPGCQVLIDRPARFCRQCGTRLVSEADETLPQSVNFDPRYAPPPTYQPGMYLDGVGVEVADTGRLYTPPSIAIPNNTPVRRRISAGKAFGLIVVFLVAIGIGTAGLLFYTLAHSGRPQSQIVDQLKTETRGQILEQIARAQAELAPLPSTTTTPLPPDTTANTPGEDKTTPLDDYRYPGAATQQSVAILGNEVIQLTTTDSFTTVREHYQKIAGSPIAEDIAGGNDKVVFKVEGTPPFIITLSRENSRPGVTSIAIMRSKLIQGLGDTTQ